MDTSRYEELVAKRDGVGLTDAEADELGRLMADREGDEYENADTLRAEEAAERSQRPQPVPGEPSTE
jgi:hypothetical protein